MGDTGSECETEATRETELYTPARSKKRPDNSADYPRNKRKKARLSGGAYLTSKNKSVSKKDIGMPCQCSKKCMEKISDIDMINNMSKFYNLNTKNEQDIYIQGLITCTGVKRRRLNAESSNRQKSFKYSVVIGCEKKEVCLAAFLSLFGLTVARVKRIRYLLVKGLIPEDKRGKKKSANAKSSDDIAAVIAHISSFPVKESHYSSVPVNYLPAQLTVKKMHQLFKETHVGTTIKYEYYNKIFKENFALRFGRPAVDTCCKCEELDLRINSKTLNEVAKRVALGEKCVHIKRSKKFQHKIKEATEKSRNDEKFLGICYDYMQNVSLPIIPVQDLFYLRQLTVSVFCIHNLRTGKNVLFIYHEGQAKKGPDEVCSFLMMYINEYIDSKVETLMLFCDNCAGQNKNNTAVRLNMCLVDNGRFKKIEQIFPIRGHSYLPCDRAFGVIKKKLRRIDRLYTIRELMELIVSSSAKPDFFTIHLVSGEDISDIKKWWIQHYKKTALSLETKDRRIPRDEKVGFQISKFHHIKYIEVDGETPVQAHEFIDGVVKHTFLLKQRPNVIVPLPNDRTYGQSKQCINAKKMADLKKCVAFVPDEYKKSFWDEILLWPTTNIEEDDE